MNAKRVVQMEHHSHELVQLRRDVELLARAPKRSSRKVPLTLIGLVVTTSAATVIGLSACSRDRDDDENGYGGGGSGGYHGGGSYGGGESGATGGTARGGFGASGGRAAGG